MCLLVVSIAISCDSITKNVTMSFFIVGISILTGIIKLKYNS